MTVLWNWSDDVAVGTFYFCLVIVDILYVALRSQDRDLFNAIELLSWGPERRRHFLGKRSSLRADGRLGRRDGDLRGEVEGQSLAHS